MLTVPGNSSRGKYNDLADEKLVSLFKETADSSIIAEFYTRYSHLIYGVCLKYLKNDSDSKDALMHVYEKLFIYLKQYEIANFKSWFYSVAKHHCLYLLKKRKEYTYEENIIVWKSPKEFVEFADDITLTGQCLNEDKTKQLFNAIEKLNEEQKICIDLFYLQEKSYQEIQEITQFTFKQVKSYIQNGKRNLKILLSEYYNNE